MKKVSEKSKIKKTNYYFSGIKEHKVELQNRGKTEKGQKNSIV